MNSYSHSMLALYRLCPLRFKLRYEDKLIPRQPPSRHDADFGNAWHAGVAALYRPDGSLKKALQVFADAYPEADYPLELPDRSKGKTFSNGLSALKGYVVRWREDDSYHKVLHVEERNDRSDGTDKILKLDLITEDQRDGQIYGWDTKTTSSYLDNNYWERFEPNSQVRVYTDHIKEKFGHCGGFYINAASFKHRSKAYTPRQGPDKGIQQPAGDWYSFARMCFNPNTECLQMEQGNFSYWITRIEADRLTGDWGYNDQSCHAFGRECEYLKLCSAGYTWPIDEELILNYYRQVCPRVLEGGRCQRDLGHEGWCDPVDRTPKTDNVITLDEDEIEDAIT
jgi:hypothetical protein